MKWRKLIPAALLAGVLTTSLLTGCQQVTEETAPTFAATWSDEGRQITVSGLTLNHKAGSQAEFQLLLDNERVDESWVSSYKIHFFDPAIGIDWEVARKEFDISAGHAVEIPVVVEIPQNYQGELGVRVLIENFEGVGGTSLQIVD